MKRRILKLGVFLLLGAIINVAVAWGLAAYGPFGAFQLEYQDRSDFGDQVDHAASLAKVGFRLRLALRRGAIHSDGQLCTGWPLLSLHCFIADGKSDGVLFRPYDLTVPAEETTFLMGSRYLPTHLICPGFAINTILYAAMLWLLVAAPFKLRRFIRSKRHRCPGCGYPVGISPVCTECGMPVK